ncbi:MAG: hypothetical protein K0B01_14285 [Syntrophobacterales bacterium]|nr:hypothetical protein [Syntrophobacterales bacterium]
MYDVDDEWEHGEKRAQIMTIIQDIVLDAMIETLTKIKQRNDWMNPAKETSKDEMKF